MTGLGVRGSWPSEVRAGSQWQTKRTRAQAGRITTDEAVEVTWEAAVAGGGEASFHAHSKATCMILVQKAFGAVGRLVKGRRAEGP